MDKVWRAYTAEFIGTFALIYIGAGSICADKLLNGKVGLLGIAAAHGLVLAVLITATLYISGGQFNPAVTFGLWIAGKIEPPTAGGYVVSQLLGAILGAAALAFSYPRSVWAAVNLGTPGVAEGVSAGAAIFVEAILTFFLVLAVLATAVDDRAARIGGFGIGMTVLFGILMGGPLTGAAMNPARTFGPALISGFWENHLVYWLGPLLGGAVAGITYNGVYKKRR